MAGTIVELHSTVVAVHVPWATNRHNGVVDQDTVSHGRRTSSTISIVHRTIMRTSHQERLSLKTLASMSLQRRRTRTAVTLLMHLLGRRARGVHRRLDQATSSALLSRGPRNQPRPNPRYPRSSTPLHGGGCRSTGRTVTGNPRRPRRLNPPQRGGDLIRDRCHPYLTAPELYRGCGK